MYKCKECNFETDNSRVFANHCRWKHSSKEKKEKSSKNMSEAKIRYDRIHSPVKRIVKRICPYCKTEYETEAKFLKEEQVPYSKKGGIDKWFKNNLCSTSCSNKSRKSPVWTEEMRDDASGRTKELWEDEEYSKKVINNNTYFSSKREREIVNYFRENFKEDEWTFGVIGSIDGERINPDLWSRKLKVVFEYDGVWHFKDIKGQLKQKQLKDRLTEKYCIENGYRLIRIDELSKLSFDKIQDLIYNKDDMVVKVGDRY